ncbi:MAG: rRNA maturation RNase YbeY [Phycisphaerae bacterium]|nr:rRNA maturation RNase YbeY [Phycisphaerae bacterium]
MRTARFVLAAERFTDGELSIAVVGARRMAALHKRFMDIAGATDVLTFDLGTDRRSRMLVGEIVVCVDVAQRQCAETRVGSDRSPRRRRAAPSAAEVRKELALYVTHGILHLAGYDDHAAADFRRMHAREDALLAQMGVGRVFSPGAKAPRTRSTAK